MKKNLFTLFLIFLSLSIFAQNFTISLNTNKKQVRIGQNDYQKLTTTFSFNGINKFDVSSEKGMFNEISIPGLYSVGEVGTPKLPAVKKLIEIPFGAEVSVLVKSYTVNEYKLSDYGIDNYIIPVQPSVSKSQDPTLVKFEFNEKAYKLWKTVPAEETNAVMEAQMMGKIADSMLKTIQSKISEGKSALQTLTEITEEAND